MENNNKENAFPALHLNAHQGMTLRDYFANSAMQGILSSSHAIPTQQIYFDNIAEDAYRLADAMLKQREHDGK